MGQWNFNILDGVGVHIVDPSETSVAAVLIVASLFTFIPNTNTINRIYQAIAIAIGITINNTISQCSAASYQ